MKSIRLKEDTEVSKDGINIEPLKAGRHDLDESLANILIMRGKAADVLMVEVEEKKSGRQAKD